MSAILFGSISTIADTSELQRQAFNQAFKVHGLDWDWNREEYLTMLENSGGQNRIADYANSILQGRGSANGQTVDAKAIHRSKSEFFQNSLTKSQVKPRLGVVETIQGAKSKGLKVAFVTTTSQENISMLMAALQPSIQVTDFDLILNDSSVDRPKPDKAAYTFALERLGERSADCIAIEDNLSGVESAIAAGLDCVAFPNENTTHHDFKGANHLVDRLDFDELHKFLLDK
jgi:HAD superfamily hydrolase (TIGR01509 family)